MSVDSGTSEDVEYRIEHDTMGEVRVPINALWRAQTQRAVENFPISGRGLERTQIRALGLLKGACAQVNKDLGLLAPEKADAIIAAAGEIADGLHDDQFPIDVFQTGSGTSSNMNTNEVIASIAAQNGVTVHPNDDVNMSQSSNDTFPTATHIAATEAAVRHLIPALEVLHESLARQGAAMAHRGEVGPHAPDGRRARDARPGVRRLCPPDRGRHRAGARPRCRGWVNSPSAARPSAPA